MTFTTPLHAFDATSSRKEPLMGRWPLLLTVDRRAERPG